MLEYFVDSALFLGRGFCTRNGLRGTQYMRQKISAENVIAGTIASLRYTRNNAYDIAKIVVRDLKHFGYRIQGDDRPNTADDSNIGHC
jgi:hypothetical protein